MVVGEFEHAERVVEKKNRVEVLRALLEMHQQQHKLDLEYFKGLRQRRRRRNFRTCGHSDEQADQNQRRTAKLRGKKLQ